VSVCLRIESKRLLKKKHSASVLVRSRTDPRAGLAIFQRRYQDGRAIFHE
jgi:hypothetical protein